MRKMKLDLDALSVESFRMASDPHAGGTVDGFEAPTPPYATCGCTTGQSYVARFCPPPSTRTTCREM